MAKKYEIYDRYGNRVENDDPVLRDGQRLVVPLAMRDSAQREVVEHFERLRAEDAAARSFGLDAALHRPGQRFADADARAHVEEVYQDEKRKLMDAWRTPVARGQQEGDVCTVREGGVAEGSPGHLRMVNGKLTCVPDRRQDSAPRGPTYGAAEGERIKAAAYAEMVDELTNAWRTPAAAPPSIEPRANTTHVPRTMSLADAQAIRDAAYRQYCDELVNAWKAR